MAEFRVGRRRPAQHLEVHDADLSKRAGRALVAADERIRVAADELGFAEAQLGAAATTRLNEALVAVHRHLSDAFRLNRLNHDVTPGTTDEVRARYFGIVELCELIEEELDEHISALADRMRTWAARASAVVRMNSKSSCTKTCVTPMQAITTPAPIEV